MEATALNWNGDAAALNEHAQGLEITCATDVSVITANHFFVVGHR